MVVGPICQNLQNLLEVLLAMVKVSKALMFDIFYYMHSNFLIFLL